MILKIVNDLGFHASLLLSSKAQIAQLFHNNSFGAKMLAMVETDAQLEARIENLKRVIRQWAESRDLWHDCGFKTWADHFDEEPQDPPVVLVFWFEGPMYNVINCEEPELFDEFQEAINATDFSLEILDRVTAYFFPSCEKLSESTLVQNSLSNLETTARDRNRVQILVLRLEKRPWRAIRTRACQ